MRRKKKIKFLKMSGAGNDFVLLESLAVPGPKNLPVLARRVCSRRDSVGADGLLVLKRGTSGRIPELDYYNADGSRAFCGNGSRCGAWWMYSNGWVGKHFFFNTIEGRVEAVVTGPERVRVRMPDPKAVRMGMKLSAAGKAWTAHTLNTGVPHAVVQVKNLEGFPVVDVGRALRHHLKFQPAGTNADFIFISFSEKSGKPVVYLRTYERGVEDETLACGTGVVAAALCAHVLKGLKSPVRVQTRGGDRLTVTFRAVKNNFKDVWLEGPAKVTFQGEVLV